MDRIPSAQRSANMRAITSKNTAPEMVVRRILHRLGYRYRLHAKDLPGKPDIVFRQRKKAILVHGCYWHGHGCKRGGQGAKSNTGYWGPKIARNRERDEKALCALRDAGWDVLTIWECEVADNDLTERLQAFLPETSCS
ncbi:DNA mismatch endonuclease Vsr [Mesorhizobium sp. B2-1-3]|uniref:very short patch repair endonuclease n=1 Tax=Mesorhizobium sp. B2-1-3 TaxID=2589972 RepID=UPI00112B92EB|nr:very short patch repair endonuclease [Mesorhizobium sp. B2-1-3]TPN16337.1 DNA mismatch endonuclease Vsr [Mesorhizobium sp. B2-1-3]